MLLHFFYLNWPACQNFRLSETNRIYAMIFIVINMNLNVINLILYVRLDEDNSTKYRSQDILNQI